MSSVGSLLLLVRPGIPGSCLYWISVAIEEGVWGECLRGSVCDDCCGEVELAENVFGARGGGIAFALFLGDGKGGGTSGRGLWGREGLT